MDASLPPEELALVKSILDSHQSEGIKYHALRSREAAARKYLDVHLLVPGSWTVEQGHQTAEQIETQMREAIPNSAVVTHVEPIDTPLSMQDVDLLYE